MHLPIKTKKLVQDYEIIALIKNGSDHNIRILSNYISKTGADE